MMNKLNSASKLRIFAIISCAIIILGMALGTILHFTSGKFFNYGGEYTSYKTVTVEYYSNEINGEVGGERLDIGAVCDAAFAEAGVSSYTKVESMATNAVSHTLLFKFSQSTDTAALESAAAKIGAAIKAYTAWATDNPMSSVSVGENKTVLGGSRTLIMATVVLAVIIAIHAIYTVIRFKLSAMLTAFVADLHNLALYAALLALCRIPVTSAVVAFGIVLELITVVGVMLTLDRIKRNFKESDGSKLSAEEITSLSAEQTRKINIALPAFLAIAALLMFAALSISSLSPVVIISAPLCALAAFVSACYGNTLFVPAIYPKLRALCGKIHFKPSRKKEKSK